MPGRRSRCAWRTRARIMPWLTIASESMKEKLGPIAVMGAGAVGCYYGGMLARAGHAVTLIGRAQHVDAVRRKGLLLDTQSFQAHVPMEASTEASGARDAKLVLFCVKSTDTASAAG